MKATKFLAAGIEENNSKRISSSVLKMRIHIIHLLGTTRLMMLNISKNASLSTAINDFFSWKSPTPPSDSQKIFYVVDAVVAQFLENFRSNITFLPQIIEEKYM